MKTNDALEVRSATVNHKGRVKNLQEKHKNQLEHLRDVHKVNMTKERNSSQAQMNNLKITNNQKQVEENLRQEKKLAALKESLDKVQTQTEKELAQLKNQHELKKDEAQKIFEINYNAKKNKNQMMIEDLDQEANLELKKLDRKNKLRESEITKTHGREKKFMKDSHLTRINMKKDEFSQQKLSQEGKFEKKLRHQAKEHKSILAKNERQQQGKLVNQKEHFTQQSKQIQKYGMARKAELQTRYETKANEVITKEENTIQNIQKKRERILNSIKDRFKKELKLTMEKDKDPFYNKIDLNPKVSETEKGYQLKLEVAPYEADKVQLTGSERTLKLSMERSFDFKSSRDGQSSSVKKAETIVNKIPIEKFIDSKTIERSYQDGVLTFTVELA